MARFKPLKFGDTRQVKRHSGKGSRDVRLPNRAALNELTGAGNGPRSINDYAKATPGPEDALGVNDYAGAASPADDY